MRVALDGTPLTVTTGGVRRYVEQLYAALQKSFPEDSWLLLSDQLTPPRSSLERHWWLWGLRREMARLSIDLFHGTDFSVPYFSSRPSVMTIHDLSPWRPQTAASASRRVRFRTPVLLRGGFARFVLTPSEAVRRELIARFNLKDDRVIAVPLAASDVFKPTVGRSRQRPYYLYVGTIESRKNLSIAIRAWVEIRKQADVDFLVAGRIRDPIDLHGAVWLGPVEDQLLPELYSNCLAAVYPSTYEGFGLPALEAMQCGAMVIASNDPAIAEITGDAALHIPCEDVRGWIEAMRSALNEQNRIEWREMGLRRAARFTWERTAAGTRAVYEQALHGR